MKSHGISIAWTALLLGSFSEVAFAGQCLTTGGAKVGVPCVFPFKARGITYTTCTKAGGFDTPWCSTMVDANGDTVLGNYGDCTTDESDPDCFPSATTAAASTDATAAQGSCLTTGGAKVGVPCVFPFKARGITYTTCTKAGGFAIPWCSTMVDANGDTVLGNYGDCPTDESDPNCYPSATTDATADATTQAQGSCLTTGGSKVGVPCVFPFKTRGVTYTSCTFAGGFSTPWCSTMVDANGETVLGNWGDCPMNDPTCPNDASTSSAPETSPAMEESSPAASETSPAIAESSAAASETSPDVAESSPAASESSLAASETSPAASESSLAASETSPESESSLAASETSPESESSLAASETSPAASESSLAASETSPAASESSLAASETSPAASESSLAASETSPAASESSLAASETSPAVSETSLAASETSPAASESSLAASESSPAPSETSIAASETSPAASETSPAASESSLAASETSPAADTSLAASETSPAASETSPAASETSLAASETSAAAETSPDATTIAPCITVSGAKVGVPCIFPFKARDVTYNSCTVAGGYSIPWCPTAVDASGNVVLGNWGECPLDDPNCPNDMTTEAPTTTESTTPEASLDGGPPIRGRNLF